MPRATIKAGREAQEIGAAIVATWFKVLPTAVPILNITFALPLSVRTAWPAFREDDRVWLSHLQGESTLNEKEYLVGPLVAPGADEFILKDPDSRVEIDGRGLDTEFRDAVLTSSVIGNLDDDAIKNELKYVLSLIIDAEPIIVVDEPTGREVHVVVPRIPPGVRSRQDLIDYLRDYHQYAQGEHYHEELGVASLFGCR
jgi:hypothetical protein